MRCEDVVIELDAYRTEELDAELGAQIERHIRQCPSCSDELEKLRKENALYQDYADAITGSAHDGTREPSATATLVVRRAAPSIRRVRLPMIRWAAAAIIVAAGLLWHLYVPRSAPSDVAAVPSAEVPMDQALKDLEQAMVLLQDSYQEKRQRLDPELLGELDRNLEITRAAIRECQQALQKDPGNLRAIEFLAFDYREQINLLQHFTEGL